MYTVLGKVEICQDVMPSPHVRRVGGVGGGWKAKFFFFFASFLL